MTIICGIDPGLNGAICLISTLPGMGGHDMPTPCVTHDMPTLSLMRNGKNKREIDPHALANMLFKSHAGHAFVEQQGGRPGQNVSGVGSMMMGYGIIIGVLAAVGIPYTIVRPERWKKALGVPKSKDAARSRASQLFPGAAEQWRLVKHDGRAESALIAHFGFMSLDNIARGVAA